MSKRLYREFYLLPRGEQRGLILLSLLLILSLLFRISVALLPDREPEGMEEFRQEASMLMASFAEADSIEKGQKDSIRRSDSVRWSTSGRSTQAYPNTYPRKTREPILPIDINRADSVQLLPLPGIGPVFAGRLIKYRGLLGGYASVDQLMEVYGMSLETFDMIADRIVIDTTSLIKLDLNSATFRELLRHPYLEYEDVKALVNYRDFAESIQSLQELEDNFILPDSVLNRVIPYIYLSKSEAVDLSK
jgi:DNA uptake protein ComE-like DNA-binding protein